MARKHGYWSQINKIMKEDESRSKEEAREIYLARKNGQRPESDPTASPDGCRAFAAKKAKDLRTTASGLKEQYEALMEEAEEWDAIGASVHSAK